MKLAGDPDLLEAYVRVIMLSEIGEHALMQFSDCTLNIERAFGTQKTLFDGLTCTLHINIDDLSLRTPEEQCAVLSHETFHFFHFAHDKVGYRFRNTIASRKFDTQEEELTINGTTSDARATPVAGLDYALFNENAVLKDRGLPPRESHGSASSSAPASREEMASFSLSFSASDFGGGAQPVRRGPPARLAKREEKKR